jgi:hypothetical protein
VSKPLTTSPAPVGLGLLEELGLEGGLRGRCALACQHLSPPSFTTRSSVLNLASLPLPSDHHHLHGTSDELRRLPRSSTTEDQLQPHQADLLRILPLHYSDGHRRNLAVARLRDISLRYVFARGCGLGLRL